MSYTPQINDYVEWKNSVHGWVYFKCDEYITIEVSVRPKVLEDYKQSKIHANNRLLVICYKNEWHKLKYIKSRSSIYGKQ